MGRIAISFATLGTMLLALLYASAARAQSQTYVSGAGSDQNLCTRAAPCATMQHAHDQTGVGGQISVLDSGSFGRVDITKSISIVAEGAVGTIVTALGLSISISVGATDVVTLRGLVLEGPGGVGIGIASNGGVLHVQNCVIRGLSVGLHQLAGELFVSDTIVADNGSDTTGSGSGKSGAGIVIAPNAGTTATAILNRVQVENNKGTGGIVANSISGGAIHVFVRDSVVIGNSTVGIAAQTPAGAASVASILIDRTASVSNGGAGVSADGSAATVWLSNSTIARNIAGLAFANGGTIASFGNNAVINNFSDGVPSTTVAPK